MLQLKVTPHGLPPNAFLPDTDEDDDESGEGDVSLDRALLSTTVLLDGNTGEPYFQEPPVEPDATASQEAMADAAPTSQD